MHTITFTLAILYWMMLGLVAGTSLGGPEMVSTVTLTLPGWGPVSMSGAAAALLALGLPGLPCFVVSGTVLWLRVSARRRATDRVLLPALG